MFPVKVINRLCWHNIGSEPFWNRRDRTVRKRNEMWIWIQLPFNETRIRISIKKSTLDLPWNYRNINFHHWKMIGTSTFIIEKLSEHQLSSLKNYRNINFHHWKTIGTSTFIIEKLSEHQLSSLKNYRNISFHHWKIKNSHLNPTLCASWKIKP